MSQSDIADKKQKLLDEIAGMYSEVAGKEEIRLRAQTEIFELLNKAVEDLDKAPTDISLNQAASKVNIARKRILQAESQGQLLPWLPILIGAVLGGVLVFAACMLIRHSADIFSASPEWSSIILGAVLWGALGSATDGLRELHTRVARQELDVNRVVWYFAHPVIGAALGGILVFVVYAGLLALLGDAQDPNPALVYSLAALGGFGQRQVIQYLRETLAEILHIKKEGPEEAG